jgi:hypothetical protein
MRTVPVNESDGPLTDGCEPMRLISITVCLLCDESIGVDRSAFGAKVLRRIASGLSTPPDVPDSVPIAMQMTPEHLHNAPFAWRKSVTGLLRIVPPHKHFCQGVQCIFEFAVIGLAQRCFPR